ncbi:MAG: ribose 5-phosphate isomerase B [Alphaproteobacteria bacterium]|nr:ribose 5-phosphate isomerase B [Alphaproteobacteria bacterium]
MFKNKKILIGSDHAGFDLKKELIKFLEENKYEVHDCGTYKSGESVDYPDYANKLCSLIKLNKAPKGILICGTGIGMSIAANRHKIIRAALCLDSEMAKLSREHNDANVLVLGARITSSEDAINIMQTFLNTNFAKGRHQKRIDKI